MINTTSEDDQLNTNKPASRDIPYWARPVAKLKVTDIPGGAVNLNVENRQVVGPLQGFGPLWQKTYRVRMSGVEVTPSEVVKVWKNAIIRSFFYQLAAPLRWVGKSARS